MNYQSADRMHPVLPREQAEQRLRETGYVRMDGHTATNQEQLDQLYEMLDRKNKGTYSKEMTLVEALRAKPDALPLVPGAPLPLSAITPAPEQPSPVAPESSTGDDGALTKEAAQAPEGKTPSTDPVAPNPPAAPAADDKKAKA